MSSTMTANNTTVEQFNDNDDDASYLEIEVDDSDDDFMMESDDEDDEEIKQLQAQLAMARERQQVIKARISENSEATAEYNNNDDSQEDDSSSVAPESYNDEISHDEMAQMLQAEAKARERVQADDQHRQSQIQAAIQREEVALQQAKAQLQHEQEKLEKVALEKLQAEQQHLQELQLEKLEIQQQENDISREEQQLEIQQSTSHDTQQAEQRFKELEIGRQRAEQALKQAKQDATKEDAANVKESKPVPDAIVIPETVDKPFDVSQTHVEQPEQVVYNDQGTEKDLTVESEQSTTDKATATNDEQVTNDEQLASNDKQPTTDETPATKEQATTTEEQPKQSKLQMFKNLISSNNKTTTPEPKATVAMSGEAAEWRQRAKAAANARIEEAARKKAEEDEFIKKSREAALKRRAAKNISSEASVSSIDKTPMAPTRRSSIQTTSSSQVDIKPDVQNKVEDSKEKNDYETDLPTQNDKEEDYTQPVVTVTPESIHQAENDEIRRIKQEAADKAREEAKKQELEKARAVEKVQADIAKAQAEVEAAAKALVDAQAKAQAEEAAKAQAQAQVQAERQTQEQAATASNGTKKVKRVKVIRKKMTAEEIEAARRKKIQDEIDAIEKQLEIAQLEKKIADLQAQDTTPAQPNSITVTTNNAAEKKTKTVLVKKQRDSEGDFISYRGKTYYTDTVDTSRLKWTKPDWTKEKKLRVTGKVELLKERGGDLANPITNPLNKGDGVNRYVRPEEILTNKVSSSNKQIGWQKPEWAVKKQLRATGKAEVLQRDGNLARPITHPQGKGDGINKYVRPEEILSNGNAADNNSEKNIGWEKPEWAKKVVLRSTKKGAHLKSGGEITRPITHIRQALESDGKGDDSNNNNNASEEAIM